MKTDGNKELIQNIFNEIRKLDISAPPYLKTRIMAGVREKGRRTRLMLWWKSIAFTSFAMVTGVILFLSLFSSLPQFIAIAGKPVAVRIEMETLNEKSVRIAEIGLPADVYFYSRRHPELREKRSLRLSLEDFQGISTLPFIVKADSPGKRKIIIRFYDQANALISEEIVKVDFREEEMI